jgi:hypothetical protein
LSNSLDILRQNRPAIVLNPDSQRRGTQAVGGKAQEWRVLYGALWQTFEVLAGARLAAFVPIKKECYRGVGLNELFGGVLTKYAYCITRFISLARSRK